MSDNSSSSSGGVGVLGLLGVGFVFAKIFGWEPVASWSWWWVTAPFWGGFAVALVMPLAILVSAGVVSCLAAVLSWCVDGWRLRKARQRGGR